MSHARANACESSSVAEPASSHHSKRQYVLAIAERQREVARALNSIALESGFTTSDQALMQFIADYFDGEIESDGKPFTHTKSVVILLPTEEDEGNTCFNNNY